ncbi:MAG: Tyrosine recombinase XerC (plasmid) [Chroococcopsis gigantea SAG 12.99]|nr:Tyrosine recombinase XerC [Chroococcopsis gigantea SAG 12.99]
MLAPSEELALSQRNWLDQYRHYIDLDVAEGNAADDTVKSYLVAFKQFLSWCAEGGIHPLEATENDLLGYRRWLIEVKKYSPASIALKLTALRRFYAQALRCGAISFNPAFHIKPPRSLQDPAERINYLEGQEAERLLECLPKDESLASLRDRLLVGLMIMQGCRTVELHRLSVGDIMHRGHDVGLRVNGKRSRRVVPLTPALARLLVEYLKALKESAGENFNADTPLFISLSRRATGERLTRRSIARIVDRYLRAAALKREAPGKGDQKSRKGKPQRQLSAHSLRHTAGTLALRTGATLRQVQDLLGHADPRTTALYTHIADRWTHNPALNMGLVI